LKKSLSSSSNKETKQKKREERKMRKNISVQKRNKRSPKASHEESYVIFIEEKIISTSSLFV
jgi:hypothetical protein